MEIIEQSKLNVEAINWNHRVCFFFPFCLFLSLAERLFLLRLIGLLCKLLAIKVEISVLRAIKLIHRLCFNFFFHFSPLSGRRELVSFTRSTAFAVRAHISRCSAGLVPFTRRAQLLFSIEVKWCENEQSVHQTSACANHYHYFNRCEMRESYAVPTSVRSAHTRAGAQKSSGENKQPLAAQITHNFIHLILLVISALK